MAKAKEKKVIRYTKAPIKARSKKGNRILASEALISKGSRNLTPKMHVNSGDNVVIISGDDAGKIGKVLEVYKKEGKILVEGVNIIKRHQKSQGPGRPGEIVEKESPIVASKAMHYDESKKKATRIGHKVLENGTKVRISKVSGEQID